MKTNKGSIMLVVSIIAILALGAGGVVYYKSTQKSSNDGLSSNPEEKNSDSKSLFGTLSENMGSLSPKEVFLRRNTEMYNAKSFEEMSSVSKKYDSQREIAENESQFKNANDEKKKAYFGFAQAFLFPTEEITNIKETITGDKALVTANKGTKKLEAEIIKENGVWKMDKNKIVN
ncbi:MAG: hypothetical protein AAB438_02035 [Patescibacteria group bacterium]